MFRSRYVCPVTGVVIELRSWMALMIRPKVQPLDWDHKPTIVKDNIRFMEVSYSMSSLGSLADKVTRGYISAVAANIGAKLGA